MAEYQEYLTFAIDLAKKVGATCITHPPCPADVAILVPRQEK